MGNAAMRQTQNGLLLMIIGRMGHFLEGRLLRRRHLFHPRDRTSIRHRRIFVKHKLLFAVHLLLTGCR